MKRLRLSAAAAILLAGGSPGHAGPLSLEAFFRGRLTATGSVENLRDDTRRPFTISMVATWAGPKGTLAEDIVYADGEKQRKVWLFTKTGEGRFVGRREDLTRDGDIVEDAQGVAMSYKANTPVPSGGSYNLAFDDRLTAVSADTVSVRSDVTYFFVPVARITMTIKRLSAR